jgi:Flp pilus assembly protein TadD
MFGNIFNRKRGKQDDKTLENYLMDAIDHFENGDYIEAADQFSLIARAYPKHPLANLMLGRTYIHQKKYEKAIDSLFRHLNTAPNSMEALVNIGLAYYECGEFGLALERFEQALKLHSNSPTVRENLAITKLELGELNGALDLLVSLHEESPVDENVIELLVLTLGKLGKWDAAKRYILEMNKCGTSGGNYC